MTKSTSACDLDLSMHVTNSRIDIVLSPSRPTVHPVNDTFHNAIALLKATVAGWTAGCLFRVSSLPIVASRETFKVKLT
jgi:hypothetical protein